MHNFSEATALQNKALSPFNIGVEEIEFSYYTLMPVCCPLLYSFSSLHNYAYDILVYIGSFGSGICLESASLVGFAGQWYVFWETGYGSSETEECQLWQQIT